MREGARTARDNAAQAVWSGAKRHARRALGNHSLPVKLLLSSFAPSVRLRSS